MLYRSIIGLCLFVSSFLSAQSLEQPGTYGEDWGGYLFGLKGGASFGNQDWSGLETEFRIGYHAALFLESIPASGRFSFYGQFGYHQRGSRISRRRGFLFDGRAIVLPADAFRFDNLSLGVGARSVVAYTRTADLYYSLGLRLEYTLTNNLSDYDQLAGTTSIAFRANYPIDSPDFVNRLTYGASAGGGALFRLNDRIGAFVELTAHPDISLQYNQGPIPDVINPFGAGNRTIPARMIRNFTLELSVGLRFLRSWRYVD